MRWRGCQWCCRQKNEKKTLNTWKKPWYQILPLNSELISYVFDVARMGRIGLGIKHYWDHFGRQGLKTRTPQCWGDMDVATTDCNNLGHNMTASSFYRPNFCYQNRCYGVSHILFCPSFPKKNIIVYTYTTIHLYILTIKILESYSYRPWSFQALWWMTRGAANLSKCSWQPIHCGTATIPALRVTLDYWIIPI